MSISKILAEDKSLSSLLNPSNSRNYAKKNSNPFIPLANERGKLGKMLS